MSNRQISINAKSRLSIFVIPCKSNITKGRTCVGPLFHSMRSKPNENRGTPPICRAQKCHIRTLPQNIVKWQSSHTLMPNQTKQLTQTKPELTQS